jgi:toxin ParE1/3/4
MAQIKWTEPALDDLNEIAEYIALDKHSAAKKLVQNLFKSVKRLKNFPKSGKIPIELQDSRYREIVVGPC